MTRKSSKASEREYEYIPLNDQTQYFYTYDLGCSAALISAGFELVSLDKAIPNKVQFIFKRKDGIDDAVNDYWSDTLPVKARGYFDNVKMLKNRIYSE